MGQQTTFYARANVPTANIESIAARGRLARTDFREFCKFVLDITPAKHQKRWVEELQKIGDNPNGQKVVIIAPPGSGKTQLVGVGFTAWMLGRYPDRHLGLLSYADTVAWSRSFAIRNLIEHSLPYRITFPEVEPDKKRWGAAEFQLKRDNLKDPHPSLRAGGTTSAVVAYRLNGLVVDDAHDPKNSATTHMLDKVWKNYEDAISTRLTSDAWEVDIGTRWNEADFLGKRLKMKGIEKIHIKALVGEKSYWEGAYPTPFLLNKEFEAPAMFALQYQGDTTGGSTQIINSLSTYSEPPYDINRMYDLVIASGWDTAFKEKEQNDFSVGYIGGMDKYGRIYILDRIKGRWGLPELLDKIIQSNRVWPQFTVWIEDAASGTPAVQTLMSQSLLPVVPVPARGGKMSRAHSLAPFLHGGHVLFPKNADWFADCEYQLTHYPNIPHVDDIDALFTLVDNLTKMRHPSSILNRPRPRIIMG